jgi:glycosyltransferase involved in cell wall biosynthesis
LNEKITIGLPVYNGEKFIHKRINSILEQTFSNFELIISDNASTDSTPQICNEFQKKDKRIRYIQQKTNMGVTWNYNFVCEQANSDYFVWAQVDDIWLPDFLKQNIEMLDTNQDAVGSMCIIDFYEKIDDVNQQRKLFNKMRKKVQSLRPNIYPISQVYEKRIRQFLKGGHVEVFYGVYRTKKLQKSLVHAEFLGNDWATVIEVLKYGRICIIQNILMHGATSGVSSKGIISLTNSFNSGSLKKIIPWIYFTTFCIKKLNSKNFCKNLDFFIQLNIEGEISLLIDIMLLFKKKI